MNFHKIFNRLLVGILLTVIMALSLSAIVHAWPFTADDAFITLRYAKHLAQGYGIVWNIGQPPVEGYSNFSYVLLEAALYYFNLPVITIIKGFSVAALYGTCLFLYLLMRLWVRPVIALLPIALLLNYQGTILWAVSGLEPPFYQFLIVTTVYCIFRGLGYSSKTPQAAAINFRYLAMAGILMVLAGLTRPELPAVFIVWVICLLYVYKTADVTIDKTRLLHGILLFCGIFLAGYLAYLAWKIPYYGRLLPNTAYCKFMAANYKFELIYDYLLVAVPLLFFAIPFFYKSRDCRPWFLLAPNLIYMPILYGVNPVVGYFSRHALGALTLLFAAAVLGISYFFEKNITSPIDEEANLTDSVQILLAILIMVCIGKFLIPHYSNKEFAAFAKDYSIRNALRFNVSNWLQPRVTPSQWIVMDDCGIVPLNTNVNVIDFFCLNSKELTSSEINFSYERFIPWIVDVKKPKFIVLMRFKFRKQHQAMVEYTLKYAFIKQGYNYIDKSTIIAPIISNQMMQYPPFMQHYRLSKIFEDIPHKYYYQYLVFKRID